MRALASGRGLFFENPIGQHMKILSQILTIYSWIIASGLVFFLFAIARFFYRRRQQKNTPPTPYPIHLWLIAAIVAFLTAAVIYVFSGTFAVVGLPVADALRIIGGAIVIFVGLSLMNNMLGGRS